MSDSGTIFKIRIKDSVHYSRGRVERGRNNTYSVNWKSKGKEWTSEKTLKKHLLTCIEKGVSMENWEIMEFTQQPSRELNEWLDDEKLTFAILKHS